MGIEQRMDQQMEINFPSLEDEKIAMANKYSILPTPENLALIEKKGHKFLYKGTPIEEYERQMNELYSDTDTKDGHYWPK